MICYMGFDVSVESTAVCVIDAAGCVTTEFSVRSHPEDLANALAPFSDEMGGIGLESGLMPEIIQGVEFRGGLRRLQAAA